MNPPLLRTVFWPALMATSIAIVAAGSRAGLPIELWAPAVVVFNLIVIAALERRWPRVDDVDLLRDPQAPRDAAHGIIVSIIGSPVGSVIATAALAASFGSTDGPLRAAWPLSWPLASQIAMAWFLYGLADYWKHRAYHSIDALWWLHAVHHDTNQMHVLKGGRLHLLEGTIRAGLVSLPLLLLGVPAEILVWVSAVDSFIGNLNHSNLDQRFPRALHFVLPTVDLHHIHHAVDRSLHDTNLGIPIFDLAFGTFTHPEVAPRPEVGIANSPVPPTLIGQLLFPLRQWRRAVMAPAQQS